MRGKPFGSGPNNPNWKGGKHLSPKGYVMLSVNGQKFAEHRYVMEQHIGRKLTSDEDVHHRDGNKQNNALENLILINHAEHAAMSMYDRREYAWSLKYECCICCGTTTRKYGARGLCQHCYGKLWREENPDKVEKYRG
jgi:hypothetical protein